MQEPGDIEDRIRKLHRPPLGREVRERVLLAARLRVGTAPGPGVLERAWYSGRLRVAVAVLLAGLLVIDVLVNRSLPSGVMENGAVAAAVSETEEIGRALGLPADQIQHLEMQARLRAREVSRTRQTATLTEQSVDDGGWR